jgi:hypothetical protein
MVIEIGRIQSEIDSRKLARAYVVLALARDAAALYIAEKPSHADLHPLLTMLDMSIGLLEEVLEHSMPPDIPLTSDNEICTELLM